MVEGVCRGSRRGNRPGMKVAVAPLLFPDPGSLPTGPRGPAIFRRGALLFVRNFGRAQGGESDGQPSELEVLCPNWVP